MPAIIQLLVSALGWLVSSQLGQWIIKAMSSLGIGFVTYKYAMPALLATLQQYSSGLSATLLQAFGAIGGDLGFSMIISAAVTAGAGKMVFKSLSAGSSS